MGTRIEKLLCDACGRATFIDNLSVVDLRALCMECAPRRTSKAEWEREALAARPPIHVLTDTAYRPTKAELEAEPTDADRAEVARLPLAALSWWAAQPSCYTYPKLAALVAERLASAGLAIPEPCIQEPTRAAKMAAAYWKER